MKVDILLIIFHTKLKVKKRVITSKVKVDDQNSISEDSENEEKEDINLLEKKKEKIPCKDLYFNTSNKYGISKSNANRNIKKKAMIITSSNFNESTSKIEKIEVDMGANFYLRANLKVNLRGI